jgi:hypothetical protein
VGLPDEIFPCTSNDRDSFSAPISKVIEFLPPNIPRILINRTVVHPSTSSAEDEGEEEDENEKEFRENYVFDAYLLGFCDDVTRALARQLFKNPETPDKKRRGKNGKDAYGGRLLTTVLKGEDDEYDADDWSTLSVPPERVLLFPGAVASKDDTSDLTFREIAHCDGCSKRIRGTVRKCVACFDYDLCQKCFPTLSKTHHNGKHSFNAEPASA